MKVNNKFLNIESKSKADSNNTAKAAGSQAMLLIVVHKAIAIYASAITGTTIEVITLIRF